MKKVLFFILLVLFASCVTVEASRQIRYELLPPSKEGYSEDDEFLASGGLTNLESLTNVMRFLMSPGLQSHLVLIKNHDLKKEIRLVASMVHSVLKGKSRFVRVSIPEAIIDRVLLICLNEDVRAYSKVELMKFQGMAGKSFYDYVYRINRRDPFSTGYKGGSLIIGEKDFKQFYIALIDGGLEDHLREEGRVNRKALFQILNVWHLSDALKEILDDYQGISRPALGSKKMITREKKEIHVRYNLLSGIKIVLKSKFAIKFFKKKYGHLYGILDEIIRKYEAKRRESRSARVGLESHHGTDEEFFSSEYPIPRKEGDRPEDFDF